MCVCSWGLSSTLLLLSFVYLRDRVWRGVALTARVVRLRVGEPATLLPATLGVGLPLSLAATVRLVLRPVAGRSPATLPSSVISLMARVVRRVAGVDAGVGLEAALARTRLGSGAVGSGSSR